MKVTVRQPFRRLLNNLLVASTALSLVGYGFIRLSLMGSFYFIELVFKLYGRSRPLAEGPFTGEDH